MAEHWMQNAVSHKGAFTKQAARAGESVSELAHEKEHAGGVTGERARLALRFAEARKRGQGKALSKV